MDSCLIERVVTVTHSTLNALTGKLEKRAETTEHQTCGTPLFSVKEKRMGVCKSCLGGWSVVGNAPTFRGRRQIEAARKLEEKA
jgi:hypothetical protein